MKGLIKRKAEKWVKKHKQTSIKYDIHLYDTRQYALNFKLEAPADIITKLAHWMSRNKDRKEHINMDEFEVDERLYPKVLKGFRTSIKEVERGVRKDIKGFRLLSFLVTNFTYKKVEEDVYSVSLELFGDYVFAEITG